MVGTHQPRLIEWLGEAESGIEALGGKGASLDRLARLGYRVPPGFCLTTTAFRAGLEAGDAVDAALTAALGRLEHEVTSSGGTGGVGGTGRAGGTGGAGVATADPRVRLAVRSSAVGEDGAEASFAGLHETELDLEPADVPAAVHRCWASLRSAPAAAYRRRRGLDEADAAMAVVVQALVPAEVSAVVFTCHPVTGREDQLVVTAAPGLGDAMVAGTITPDTLVVDRRSREVAEFVPGDGPGAPVLGSAILSDLVGLSLAVERDFGRAVDIEAAHAGGAWYLLQARPITTAPPAPVQA